jgi:hypothetical protein
MSCTNSELTQGRNLKTDCEFKMSNCAICKRIRVSRIPCFQFWERRESLNPQTHGKETSPFQSRAASSLSNCFKCSTLPYTLPTMAKYHYDEAGNMAAYFLLTFLALILIPLSISLFNSPSIPIVFLYNLFSSSQQDRHRMAAIVNHASTAANLLTHS